jgi:hypothetical protein
MDLAQGILIALTNPVSPEREDEFNDWYNNVHGGEVTILKGFAAMTRYRATAQAVPPADTPRFNYLAVYELDDVEQALRSLAEDADKFQMSDAVDLNNALGIGYQKIFSTKD